MTRAGRTDKKELFTEMVLIVLVAAVIGIAWNHTLLYHAWTGQAPTDTRKDAQPGTGTPLPLGLMQVKEMYDRKEALFIDARDAVSFASGHIAGALSLPVGAVDARLPRFMIEIHSTRTLVVYCNGYDCHDSRELGALLLHAGYRMVYVFEGGYPEWRDAGYPTEGEDFARRGCGSKLVAA